MSENITTAVIQSPPKAALPFTDRGIRIESFEGLWRFSTVIMASRMAPKGFESTESICVALQMGAELGLPPMASLQNIAVINGRPAVWGDAQLGIVRASGQLVSILEWYEQAGKRLPRNPVTYTDDTVAVCKVQRQGYDESEYGFSVADAKLAGLWGKQGPWSQYPGRMLKYRARGFVLRDQFGDLLRGLVSAEEAQDLPPMKQASGIVLGDVAVATEAAPALPPAQPEPQSEPAKRRGRPPKSSLPPEAPNSASQEVQHERTEPPARSIVQMPSAAPSAPQDAPAAGPEDLTPDSPQHLLRAYVTEIGGTFDEFLEACFQTGATHLVDGSTTWADIKSDCARVILEKKRNSIGSLLRAMVETRKGGAK